MTIRVFIASILSLYLAGCGHQFQAAPIDLVDQRKSVLPPAGPKPPSCETPRTMYTLDIELLSLEITSRHNVKFGFDLLNDWFKLFEAKIDVARGRLDLVMNIKDAINPEQLLASGSGSAKMSKREFSFQLGIKEIGLGYNSFSRTPLAKLTAQGLNNTLKRVSERLRQTSEEWSSMVQYVETNQSKTEVVIAAGAASNIKLGDELAFYNVTHTWKDKPCQSEYLFRKRTTTHPLATGKITQLRNHAALVELDPSSKNANSIKVGAEATVSMLVEPNRRLYQPLQIRKVQGGLIEDEEGTEVDLGPYLEKQVSTLAHQHHFVLFEKD